MKIWFPCAKELPNALLWKSYICFPCCFGETENALFLEHVVLDQGFVISMPKNGFRRDRMLLSLHFILISLSCQDLFLKDFASRF